MASDPAARPWCYDQLFDSVRKAWDDHDKTCESLLQLWLGRKGGVSCPSDLTDCAVCGVTFYNEGVENINWKSPDPDAEPDYRCECHRRDAP